MQERMRSVSGAVLYAFVTCHLLNHALGVVSFEALEVGHTLFMTVWRTMPGTAILLTALIIHYAVALAAIARRRTMKMSGWETGQIASGLILPFLLYDHIMGTRIAEEFAGIETSYRYVVAAQWVADPVSGVMRGAALVVAWMHGTIGLHFWLRTQPWYAARLRAFIITATAVPILALSGYVAAGFEILNELERDHRLAEILAEANYDAERLAPIARAETWVLGFLIALSVMPFAIRAIRSVWLSGHGKAVLQLPDGQRIPVPPGATALEAIRAVGRPHAAVCGGRGRCTTCRVRIAAQTDFTALEAPNPMETAALARIKALEGVRLACQIRPKAPLSLIPLLPPTATASDARRPGGLEGEERQVSCLFVDIRGSTRLGEEKLPYDVLFILNQFFSEMSAAIEETGGHYAQFNGDGLMALYGLTGPEDQGARAALAGAQAMLRHLERLNASLESELPFPLRVGIGIHFGEAIVGAMGPPRSQMVSAIGDSINIAARLESLTKDHDVPLVLSDALARKAGLDPDTLPRAQTALRGRDAPMTIHPVADPLSLTVAAPAG